MIGPVNDYASIYVARCGRQFTSQAMGRDHERGCRDCRWEHDLDRADLLRKELKEDGGLLERDDSENR